MDEIKQQVVKENKMGTRPMFPLIVSMALPTMFSMLVQALYNVVDSYFVAQVSEDSLTAVSLVFPIQTLLIAFAVGTGVGINSLVARRLGEKRQEEADNAATHGLLLGVCNWILFALVGLFGSQPFFAAFTSDAALIKMGVDYMSIVCIFSFGVFVEINIEKMLQATGNMIYPMIFQLIGAVVNIILDPVFIFGYLGMPAMGVAGAAIATVIGQILSMITALIVLFTQEHDVKVQLRGFRFHWQTVKNIYVVGAPSIVMQAIGSVMTMGMNAILITFGNTAVAFFGVYFKLQSFVFMPVFGLTQGVMPIMGYNFGARNKHRLLSALRICCIIAIVIMAAGLVVFQLFPAQLLSIFNASSNMLAVGVPALRTISLCFIPAALGIAFSTLFQAVGSGISSLIVSLLRQLILLLPCAYFLSQISLDAVWYSFPLAEVFSFVASMLMAYRIYRLQIRNMPDNPSVPQQS